MYLLERCVTWIEYDLPEWVGLSRDSGEGLSSPYLCEACRRVMTWLLSEIEYRVGGVNGVTLGVVLYRDCRAREVLPNPSGAGRDA